VGVSQLSKEHRAWVRSLHRKKVREKEGVFVAEGLNALEAAGQANRHAIVEVITDRDHRGAIADLLPGDLPVYECSGSVLKELSTEKTPQGVVTICHREIFDFSDLDGVPPDTLPYLDRVSDPGNLGTIVRTCAWFGIGRLVLSPSCVDPFNPKAIRASAGSIFKVKVYQSIDYEQIQGFAERMDYRMVAMVPEGGGPPDTVMKTGRKIVMLGQEADGLSEKLTVCADQLVSIPGQGDVESLNLSVAAAIILYEITR